MTFEARLARADDADYAAFTRFWAELGIGTAPARDYWFAHLCPATMFLVEDGVHAAYNLSFAFGARGDVRQIVVGPEFRQRGVGKQLMAAVRAKLRAAGCTDWRLEVRANNAAARALYHAVGMRALHAIESVRMSAADCARFADTRSGAHVVERVSPSDDPALEAAHDLGAGQIQRWRTARVGSPLVRIGAVGLAQLWRDHAPDHGVLFPFRAADPDVAAHLMAAALPIPNEYEVVVTTPSVHAALLAHGARPYDTQIEMAGPL